MKTKEDKLKLVDETILYYSENTKRRCISLDEEKVKCFYHGENNVNGESEGCAIGRLLPKHLSYRFDKDYTFNDQNASVGVLFKFLPQDLKGYGLEFLMKLQDLHDLSKYWDVNSLSPIGKERVKLLKNEIENNII